MHLRPDRATISVLLALTVVVLVVVPSMLYTPTYVTWLSQQQGVFRGGGVGLSADGQVLRITNGSPTLEQEVLGVGRSADAVALRLPTDGDSIEGVLQVALTTVGSAEEGEDDAHTVSTSLDLAGVTDWGMAVLRFPGPPLDADSEKYLLEIGSEGNANLIVSGGDPYPGVAWLGGQEAGIDVVMRVYERVSWPEFVRALSGASESDAPAWILAAAVLFVPALLGFAVWAVLEMGRGNRAQAGG